MFLNSALRLIHRRGDEIMLAASIISVQHQ
jgi:hypothetical protein